MGLLYRNEEKILAGFGSSDKFLASSGVLRSRGNNFQFKNIEIFEIHQTFAEIGRFEFGISSEDPKSADFHDFPLRL